MNFNKNLKIPSVNPTGLKYNYYQTFVLNLGFIVSIFEFLCRLNALWVNSSYPIARCKLNVQNCCYFFT